MCLDVDLLELILLDTLCVCLLDLDFFFFPDLESLRLFLQISFLPLFSFPSEIATLMCLMMLVSSLNLLTFLIFFLFRLVAFHYSSAHCAFFCFL